MIKEALVENWQFLKSSVLKEWNFKKFTLQESGWMNCGNCSSTATKPYPLGRVGSSFPPETATGRYTSSLGNDLRKTGEITDRNMYIFSLSFDSKK